MRKSLEIRKLSYFGSLQSDATPKSSIACAVLYVP